MLNKYLTKDLKTSLSVLSRTKHMRTHNTVVQRWFLTFPILYIPPITISKNKDRSMIEIIGHFILRNI